MDKLLILNKLILHYANGNNGEFAKLLGISQSALSMWKTRGTLDYEKIFTKCENLNPYWLLTGKGEMLNTTESTKDGSDANSLERRLAEIEKKQEIRDKEMERIMKTLEKISSELEERDKKHHSLCG
ncbi:MAG: helix-turn-helix domain-containing protein [Paludibacteraceae bacterium]|nr:helix-turn-helix domain-containing protein [Paludibacteraceae bacterium]